MKTLGNCKWKAFRMSEILDISACSFTGKGVVEPGNVPYVGATQRNNGVLNFLDIPKSKVIKGNCIVFICNGDGSIGLSVYRKSDFVGSVDVKIGRSEHLNQYVGMFISTVSDKIRPNYSFGYKRTLPRLRSEHIMLPVTESGEPDYAYMEEYMRSVESVILEKYSNLQDIALPQAVSLDGSQWKAYNVLELFDFFKGNQNNMNALSEGNIPLVSAKKIDNGVKGFISGGKKELFEGHCLSLNNDGDGGAGLAYYQPTKMAVDTHVTVLRPKDVMSKYSLLFISRAISSQRELFGHGHSINQRRLAILNIMLPVAFDGRPDYSLMDKYMRYLESVELLRYRERKHISNGERV